MRILRADMRFCRGINGLFGRSDAWYFAQDDPETGVGRPFPLAYGIVAAAFHVKKQGYERIDGRH
jgi:hypothetical protein